MDLHVPTYPKYLGFGLWPLSERHGLTMYYIIKSGRPYCDGCGVFLMGLFFTCLNCFESSHTTFDLCSACYRGRRFVHPHAAILDNYILLTHKRLMTMGALGVGHPNMSQVYMLYRIPSLILISSIFLGHLFSRMCLVHKT